MLFRRSYPKSALQQRLNEEVADAMKDDASLPALDAADARTSDARRLVRPVNSPSLFEKEMREFWASEPKE